MRMMYVTRGRGIILTFFKFFIGLKEILSAMIFKLNCLIDNNEALSKNFTKRRKYWIVLGLIMLLSQVLNAQATYTVGVSDEQLLNQLTGPGVLLSNASLQAGERTGQLGLFSNGVVGANLAIEQGIVLSTGSVTDALSTNDNIHVSETFGNSSYTDVDIYAIDKSAIYDVVVFSFDVVLSVGVDKLTIDYQFASDEYPDYVGSRFNDIFGFFVSGGDLIGTTNIALVPNSTNAVAVNSVNAGFLGNAADGAPVDLTKADFYINNGHDLNGALSNTNSGIPSVVTEYNGITKKFIGVITGLTPGVSYTFKMAIADTGDTGYDSAVFINQISATGAPVAVDDYYSVLEDDTIIITPLLGDSDSSSLEALFVKTINNVELIGTNQSIPVDHGLVEIKNNVITFIPSLNYHGAVVFPYEVSDSDGNTSEAKEYITITPVNDVPIAIKDSYEILQGETITLNPLDNDTDVDIEDVLKIIEINGVVLTGNEQSIPVSNGTVMISETGIIQFIPTNSFKGITSFSYVISDGEGGQSTSIQEISVLPMNTETVVINDTAQVDEAASVIIDVIANDTDDDGDGSEKSPVKSITQPSNGVAVILPDGTVEYTPNTSFSGTDTFTYTNEEGAEALVTITVVDQGDPLAKDDLFSTDEDADTAIEIDAIANDDLIDNASYSQGSLNTSTTMGTVTDHNDGTFSYIPAPGFSGNDSFTYEVCDDDQPDATCDMATVTITVFDQGTPKALEDVVSLEEGAVEGIVINVLENDALIDNAGYKLGSLDISETLGTVIDNLDGTFTYIANSDFSGQDTFSYTICDDDQPNPSCDTAIVIINISDQGDPSAQDDAVTITEDDVNGISVNALVNDILTDNASYKLGSLDISDTSGIVVDNGDGTFKYTPSLGFSGDDSFKYTICDDDSPSPSCSVATIIVHVTDQGTPIAKNDYISLVHTQTIASLINVLSNDALTDNASYKANSLDITGTVGTVIDNGDGTFSYVPDPLFIGEDTFSYTICDDDSPLESCSTATVKVTVMDEGDPIANNDDIAITEDASTSTTINVLGNDILLDEATYKDGSLDFSDTLGTVIDLGDGSFSYVAPQGFSGVDTFLYTICDHDVPVATCDTAIVSITVSDEGKPTAIADIYSISDEEGVLTINATLNDILTDNASYKQGSLNATNTQGIVTDNGDGTFDYLPQIGFIGVDTFEYTICDDDIPDSQCSTNTVTINVSDEGDPQAVDDTISIIEDTVGTSSINAIDNDLKLDGAVYKVGSLDLSSTIGQVTDNGDGTFEYVPAAGFVGTDTFKYSICDHDLPSATCDTATVTIIVSDQGDPKALDDVVTVLENTTMVTVIESLLNDDLTDDATYAIGSLNTTGTLGTVTDNGDGTFDYVPLTNFSGVDTFSYTICDDDSPTAFCATATIFVTVADGGTPIASDDSVFLKEDTTTPTEISVLENDALEDNAAYLAYLAGSLDVLGTVGVVVDHNDGTFSYTPIPGFSGEDSFKYTICDDDNPIATCSTAIVNVQVLDEGDPIANADVLIINNEQKLNLIDVVDNDELYDNATYNPASLNTTSTLGEVTDNRDGTFEYQPMEGFEGEDSFKYSICDDDTPVATCSETVVTIVVNNAEAPIAVDDEVSITEDHPDNILIDVIANDDISNNGVYKPNSLDASMTNGEVVDNGDGTFSYMSTAGFSGIDSFSYEICNDLAVGLCDMAEVTIVVLDQGNPVAINDSFSVNQDQTIAIHIDAIANDILSDDAAYDIGSVNTTNTVGTVTANQDGSFEYVPAPGFVGDDSFEYTICDDDSPIKTCATATVVVTVLDTGDPVGNDDFVTLMEDSDSPVVFSVVENDGIVPGVEYSGNLESTPSNGTLTYQQDGVFEYIPNEGFSGEDSFVYTICDDEMPVPICSSATVVLHVVDQGDPLAVADIVSMELTEEKILINALSNDDLNDDASYQNNSLDITGTSGTVLDNGDGTFEYTPALGFTGTDSFSYTICDDDLPIATCATTTVSILVYGEVEPVAQDDNVSVTEDALEPVVFSVIENDLFVEGTTYEGSLEYSVSNGTLSYNGAGVFEYIPNPGFDGEDQFKYTVCDDGVPTPICSSAVVNIHVIDQGSPTALDDEVSIGEDDGQTLIINALENDNLIDNASYSPGSLDVSNTSGMVEVTSEGAFSYIPSDGFVGLDTFTYAVCDDDIVAQCSTATVTVHVVDNGDPIARDDQFVVHEDRVIDINALENDSKIDGETYKEGSLDTSETVGTVVYIGNGVFEYEAAPGYAGVDSFLYTICDNDVPVAVCSTATVYVTVYELNSTNARDDVNSTIVNETVNGNVLINDFDDQDELQMVSTELVEEVKNGTLEISEDGTYTYTPNDGFVGTDSFKYRVCDTHSHEACDVGTVTIDVLEPLDLNTNNPVVAVNDTALTEVGVTVSGNVRTIQWLR